MGNPEVEKERRAQVMALCRANEDGASPCRSKGNLNQAFSQGIEGEVTKKVTTPKKLLSFTRTGSC